MNSKHAFGSGQARFRFGRNGADDGTRPGQYRATPRRRIVWGILVLAGMALAACDQAESSRQDAAQHLSKGWELAQRGDLAAARVELRIAAAAQPVNAAAFYDLGVVEERLGDLKAAFADYSRAAIPAARHLKAQMRVAEMLADAGQRAEALRRINVTLGVLPDSTEALGLRADIEERSGLSVPAQADANATLKADPANIGAVAVLADVALKSRDAERALAIIGQHGMAASTDLRLLRVRAVALTELRRWDDAIATYGAIVSAAPRDPQARLALAETEESAGRRSEAEQTVRDGLHAAPGDHDMVLALINFLVRHRGRATAETVAADLITTTRGDGDADDGVIDIALASLQADDGNRKAAIDTLTAASGRLGGSPSGLRAKIALAKLWGQAGDPVRAERLLDAVVAADPPNDDAVITRAALYTAAGRGGQAVTDLAGVIGRDPTDVVALQALAVAYASVGDSAHAVEAMRRAADTHPDDAALRLQLVVMLQRAGQARNAADMLDEMTRRQPDYAPAWVTGAQLAMARKDWDAATVALKHLQSLAPGSIEVLRVEGQLDLARGDHDAALSAFARLVTVSQVPEPADLVSYAQAAVAAGQPGPVADALRQRAATLGGPLARTCYLLAAGLRISAGKLDEADSAFALATAINPTEAESYVRYGQVLIDARYFPHALQIVAQGLRVGVPREPLLLVKGSAEMAAGEIGTALATYRGILQDDPSSMIAANNYAALLAEFAPDDRARMTEARKFLAPAATSGNPAVLDSLAWLDYGLGDLEAAKTLSTRAYAAAPSDAAIKRHHDVILVASGRPGIGGPPRPAIASDTFSGPPQQPEEAR